jgi:dTDP-4-amino-4,6-dideoxygalactose transaminase
MWERRQRPGAVASRIAAEGINLPSGVRLRRAQVDHVCRVIRGALPA